MLIRRGDFEGKLRKYVPSHIQAMLNKPLPFPDFEELDLDLRLEELYDRLQVKNLRAEREGRREILCSRRGGQKPFYKTLWSSESLRKGAVPYAVPVLSDLVLQ